MATLIEINAFFCGNLPIPKSKVVGWMQSTDIRVVGAVLHIILKASSRIKPALTMEEYGDILLHAALRVVASGNKDDESEYAYTDYEAAQVLCWWIVKCHNQTPVQARKCLDDAKQTLADFYQNEGEDARRCIVDGALEHIFEVEELQKFFNDWKSNADLAQAYREAKEWGDWHIQESQFLVEIAKLFVERLKAKGHRELIVRKANVGQPGTTVEWLLPDKSTRQQLVILSHIKPAVALDLMKNDDAFTNSVVEFALNAKNWEKSDFKENVFTVTVPARLSRIHTRPGNSGQDENG